MQGIELFRQAMEGFEDQYVLIGGAACHLLKSKVGEVFRPTKDLDIVLLETEENSDFAKALWGFIEDGRYAAHVGSGEHQHYYRFVRPQAPGYPTMLEFFARRPTFLDKNYEGHLTPFHLSDEVASLSAILLDDAYFDFLLSGMHVYSGISLPQETHVIVLKMRAYIDLEARKSRGEKIDSKNVRKHLRDVVDMARQLTGEEEILLSETLQVDVEQFIRQMRRESEYIQRVHQSEPLEQIVNLFQKVYLKAGTSRAAVFVP